MATERLSMRKTREILRQKWLLGCSNRAVAQSVGVSVGAVGATLRRAREAGLTWDGLAGRADDARLEARLYPRPPPAGQPPPQPDCGYLPTARRTPGVTLARLQP